MKINRIYLGFVISFIFAGFRTVPLFISIPQPSGPYNVGVSQKTWSYFEDRLLNIHIFYPAQSMHEAQKYVPLDIPYIQEEISKKFHVPLWLTRYLFNYSTHAHLNAPPLIQEKKYPVIIFSHGIGGINLYNVYLEELASHGYIIVAVTHPGDTLITVFDNKTLVFLNPELKGLMDRLPQTRSQIYEYRKSAHEKWCNDIRFVLDTIIEKTDSSSDQFFSFFDVDALGIWGHSHGGAVALDICSKNDRIKAGIDMDGWMPLIEYGLCQKPFLFLLNEEGLEEVENLQKNMPLASLEKIKGAMHDAFTDFIFTKKFWAYFFNTYQGNNKKIFSTISSSVRVFFNSILKKN